MHKFGSEQAGSDGYFPPRTPGIFPVSDTGSAGKVKPNFNRGKGKNTFSGRVPGRGGREEGQKSVLTDVVKPKLGVFTHVIKLSPEWVV